MSGSSADGTRYQLLWFGRTSVGCKRRNNEDALVGFALKAPLGDLEAEGSAQAATEGSALLSSDSALLAVADGMGGAKAGEVASQMAVRIVAGGVRAAAGKRPVSKADEAMSHFERTVKDANEAIRDNGRTNPARRGMGTTLTAAWLHGDWVQLAQVGDSRAYRFRAGKLVPLTKDQSLVAKLLEDEIITEAEAENMSGRNIILQALGSEDELDVVPSTFEVKDRDLLMLCTDGLTGVLRDEEVVTILKMGGSLQDLCDELIRQAEEAGGPDNITVILGRIQAAS